MPLRDHFRPPVCEESQWQSFAANWLTRIADQLCERVPDDYAVWEFVKAPVVTGVDVVAEPENGGESPGRSVWQLGRPSATAPAVLPPRYEVHVSREFGGRHLVAVVGLVIPEHKESAATRRAFTSKVSGYIHSGVCVLIVDAVTDPLWNLHNDICRSFGWPDPSRLPSGAGVYAAVYRPVIRESSPTIDIWHATFGVGDPLPTMPLRLIADYFVPVELEATYTEACRRRRLI
jgi:hypothetical protein